MPRIGAVPPRRSDATARFAEAGRPTASIARSTPPFVISTICFAASSASASTTSVAPSFMASARFSGTGSAAMMLFVIGEEGEQFVLERRRRAKDRLIPVDQHLEQRGPEQEKTGRPS